MIEPDEYPADFCSESIRDAQKVGFAKAEVYSAAGSAGIITKCEAEAGRLRHEVSGATAIGYTYQNYGPDALRRGSADDLTGLEKIIGPDMPSDPDGTRAIVKQMAQERRHGG
jgi:hypothetical protein